MATGVISSVNSEKISHWFTRALLSVFLEWLLLFMLFIDTIFLYLITKFAHKCKLQTPCLLCSRLDHVFGKDKLKFYWDLVCGDHKLEISSLVYCHAHNKLVDVHGMCESCLFSFATINKSNAETYRLLVGKLGEDFDFGLKKDPSLENHKIGPSTTRHCSCCNEPWMPRGYVKTLIQTKSTVSQAAARPLPASIEHGKDDQNRSDNASISVKVTHQRKNGPDPLSHVAYTQLKITSDAESEVFSDADNEEDALNIQADHLQRDIVDQHVHPESRTITLSDDFSSKKLMDPVSALRPSIFTLQSQSDIIEPLGAKSLNSTDASEYGLKELNWQQSSSKIELSAFSELISRNDVPLSSKGGEASIDVSTEINLNSLDKVPPLPNAGEIPIQGSEDSKLISLDYLSSSSLGNETPVEVSKESNPISAGDASPSNVVVSSVEESKDSVVRALGVEEKSVAECEEICKLTEQPLPGPESPVEKNHVASDTSIQALNSWDLSDAYKLGVASKGRQLSGLLVEQWSGKDSSRPSKDMKVLSSQLSAARWIEQPMNDVSPRTTVSPRIHVSPRISINSDELKASDSSILNGIQILQNRISLERNESGLSTDGSIVSEIEGESVVGRLKRQVEHDRKLLSALYKELEEERNASAVAANQAMAMITRLQEEKATLHMEALQNLRMMEEQAEYDVEALQNTNDLLVEKEKEIQDLEAELEFYWIKFPNESMLEDIPKSAYDLKARHGTVDHSEANGIEERESLHTEPVSEEPNICSTVQETDQSFRDTNEGTMKNPLSGSE